MNATLGSIGGGGLGDQEEYEGAGQFQRIGEHGNEGDSQGTQWWEGRLAARFPL